MRNVTSSDGSRIAYSVSCLLPPWEEPAATILMHHGVGFNRDAWTLWEPVFVAAGYRVIRLDMRGHGDSVRPEPGFRWSTEQFCRDINAILDREGVERAHFVGESWGGTIGLAWAATSPERAATLGVMSTTYNGRLVPRIDTFPAMIRDQDLDTWSKTMLEARFLPNVETGIREWADAAQNACTGHVIAEVFEYILTQNIETLLPRVAAPVIVMAPQGSPFVAPQLALDLHDMLGDSELAKFPGHRHGLVLSGGRLAAETLLNFIRRRQPAP